MDNIKYYTIGEVCEYLSNKGFKEFYAHNLRYLEKVLEDVFEIRRDVHLNRVYVKEDIEKIETILNLREQGLNYTAIRNVLVNSNTVEAEIAMSETQQGSIEEVFENNKILIQNENIDKFKEIMTEITNNSISTIIVPKLEDFILDISNLQKQNIELKLALEVQQDEHFRRVDEKLTKWREESKNKKSEKKKSWFKKAIS